VIEKSVLPPLSFSAATTDLPPSQRRSENRNAAVFLVGFLVFCAVVAVVDFPFYTWTIELACAVVYVAIFMFAFSIKDYSSDSPSLFWGTSFLFTFVFEAVYFYLIAHGGGADFRLAPRGTYFWVCTQWFQAFSFLIVLIRHLPHRRLWPVILTCGVGSVVLISVYLLFPDWVFSMVTEHRLVYLGGNAVCFVAFYTGLLVRLVRHWKDHPPYFALRSLVSLGFSVVACVGILLTSDAGPVAVFVFTYLRFVALAVCYNANVTFTLHSPYRTLYERLVTHADQLAQANELLQDKIQNNTELKETLDLLHSAQDRLVESAKLTASGQLIAGISHDLNTPLGAIQSSSGMLRSLLADSQTALFHAWEALDSRQRGLFQAGVAAVVASDGFLDSRSEHKARHRWKIAALKSGKPGAEDLAQRLVHLGLGHQDELLQAILALENPTPLVDALEPLATIYQLSTVIDQASSRASKVVGALQNFLRTGSEGEKQLTEVKSNISSILGLFQPQLRRGLRMTVRLEEAWVLAWPDKLTQVWVNLITNAVQAAGPLGRVAVTMKLEGSEVWVSVGNDGPNVPDEIREKIFDLFFTTKAAGEGTGLGLYVCRRIVGELGGELLLGSEAGQTVFTVRLRRELE